ncbi:MAG TPA: hypothetical protein VHB21_09165 [Minicystis sp.]|nr:hypothetical protein [Minicystis sp.]
MHRSTAIFGMVTCGAVVALAGACGGGGDTAGSGAGGATSASGGHAAGGGTAAGGATGAGGSGGNGPVTPTASTWLGTNVSADLPRLDVAYQLQPFDTPAAQKDANGYPIAGASGASRTDIGFVLPTGVYTLVYEGSGALSVSGIGTLMGSFTTVGGEHRGKVAITGTPGAFGNFLTLQITNGPGQTVTGVRLIFPGHAPDEQGIFLPEFLRLLTPFRALRFMDWCATNDSTLSDWADRPQAAHYGASGAGEPYEHIVALVNQTGKDAWINVPEHATDDFIHAYAKFFATNLDFDAIAAARAKQGITAPFRLIVEFSNETWNQGFSAYSTLLAEANADPARYTGVYDGSYGPSWMSGSADLMKVGQVEGDHLAHIGEVFRAELGSHADAVAPVLSGWALGAVYSDVALRFVAEHYGDPKKYVTYVALAPYFGADDAQTGALDTLFASATADIDAMDPTFQDFAKLAKAYGLEIAAYEGGQSLTGQTNQTIKHLAQHDARMRDTYDHYLALWKKDFGESTFMHFSLAGDPGLPESIYQYGYWGSILGVMEDPAQCGQGLPTLTGTEMIADVVHHCPKYQALQEKVPK